MHLENMAVGRGRILSLLLAVTAALALLGAGCTSDPADSVGVGLIDTGIDSTLLELDLRLVSDFAGLRVDNPDVPLAGQQALYMGTEQDTRAVFLVNFDFSTAAEEFRSSLFDVDSIKSVKFELTKLLPYKSTNDSLLIDNCRPDDEDSTVTVCDTTVVFFPTGEPLDLYYWVQELTAPFDSAAVAGYPATIPAFLPSRLNENFVEAQSSSEPVLTLFAQDVVRWLNAGTRVGFLFSLAPESDPGLVGYASRDLFQYSEVPALEISTFVGPNLLVSFSSIEEGENGEDVEVDAGTLVLDAAEDATVWVEVQDLPTDDLAADTGFVLRTGLRSYPSFVFDTSSLPQNVRINRAVFSVENDTSLSYGPTMSIQVSEIVAGLMDPAVPLTVDDLTDEASVYPLGLRTSLRTNEDVRIEFDVTDGMQRLVNRVNAEARGFILSGIEDKAVFAPSPDVTLPDFYYRQFHFRGLADPDPDRRPFLKVWYSLDADIAGGGK